MWCNSCQVLSCFCTVSTGTQFILSHNLFPCALGWHLKHTLSAQSGIVKLLLSHLSTLYAPSPCAPAGRTMKIYTKFILSNQNCQINLCKLWNFCLSQATCWSNQNPICQAGFSPIPVLQYFLMSLPSERPLHGILLLLSYTLFRPSDQGLLGGSNCLNSYLFCKES